MLRITKAIVMFSMRQKGPASHRKLMREGKFET
jgi:hypothetical protein